MKIVTHFILFAILAICNNAFAQKQNNQWRFGGAGAIDFNTVPPSFVNGCVIAATEGSASVADRVTGVLLFYTDGVTVWNANNQVMPNGTGLLGGDPILLTSTTAAVIVPKPGSSNLYYIVTVHELLAGIGVHYSLLDMTLNGGLGDIVAGQKNVFLFLTDSEKLEVVPASNGTGFWLLTHDFPGNSFYAFEISNTGIQNTPVVSTVGSGAGLPAGHMKINRQFNKMAKGAGAQMEVFDFDNATGIVSNPIAWNVNLPGGLVYGIEFSPDGKVLYISDFFSIFQYDLTQTTPLAIQNSLYQIPTGAGSLQLGIDDKIYVSTGCLSAINCPNNLGAACGFETCVIANQTSGGGGLPKWVYYPNDTATFISNGIVFSDSCFGNATQFSIQNTAGISSITWNFGDPNSGANNTSVGFNANHTFSQIGNYNIRAIFSNACGTDTLFLNALQIVNCNPTTITDFNLIGDTCNVSTNITFQPIGSTNSNVLTWTFDDPNSGNNSYVSSPANPNAFHTFSAAGNYNVCLIFQEPGFAIDTICKNVHIGQCCIGNITSNDTCLQNRILFSIITGQTISSVLWNFDDHSSGANNTSTLVSPTHLFSTTGTYNISSIVNFSCGADTIYKTISVVNCASILGDCQVFIPNTFTPNADGLNDKFYPLTNCSFEYYECLVFNRWGHLMFKTSNQFNKWNGKFKGADCPTGVYIYLITYKFPSQPKKNVRKSITLLR